jgi:CRISPR-associated protein Cas1
VLSGRLGLEGARIPHADRYGLLWLERGNLTVKDGTLRFAGAGGEGMDAGVYDIPYQTISMLLLGPGTTVSHDVFRLAARHGLCLTAVGEDGVRLYTAPPSGPDESALARRQAVLWADPDQRNLVARRMYALRLGEMPPARDISALRGIEGARMRETYRLLARRYGLSWSGRKYDRKNPEATDTVNMAINHASVAVRSAAAIAVASVGAIAQLGFIHEDSGMAFTLDISDLFRDSFILPIAFEAVKTAPKDSLIERQVRRLAGETFQRRQLIPEMIEAIKGLINPERKAG